MYGAGCKEEKLQPGEKQFLDYSCPQEPNLKLLYFPSGSKNCSKCFSDAGLEFNTCLYTLHLNVHFRPCFHSFDEQLEKYTMQALYRLEKQRWQLTQFNRAFFLIDK